MAPILEIDDLSVAYRSAGGDVHAVEHVNLSLNAVEVVGLCGESGSGKSTLAYGATRLLRPPALITGDKAIGPNGDKRRNRSVDFKSSDFGTAGHVPHSDRPICGA